MNPFLHKKKTALTERALTFAKFKHGDQKRKYTFVPYFTHLEDVADLVASVTDDREMIAAALLHDTLEDTDTTHTELVEMFGQRIADLVKEVTDVSRPEDGNRKVRKALDRDHLANASADGMTIKLADLIDNTKTITFYDPKFSVTYLAEKAALLEVLKAGNSLLWEVANDQVRESVALLPK